MGLANLATTATVWGRKNSRTFQRLLKHFQVLVPFPDWFPWYSAHYQYIKRFLASPLHCGHMILNNQNSKIFKTLCHRIPKLSRPNAIFKNFPVLGKKTKKCK